MEIGSILRRGKVSVAFHVINLPQVRPLSTENATKTFPHTGKLKRIKERYEREMAGHNESRRKSNQLTRSKTMPYDRDVCAFCEKAAGHQGPLHSISTTSAGHSLRVAIETAENARFQVKLSTAIDSEDAAAIDIKYHKKCWARNVTSVLRKGASNNSNSSCLGSAEIATEVEFLDLQRRS